MASDARPPVPPRPPQSPPSSVMGNNARPPVPPLPPNFRADDQEARYGSSPHFTDPMLAPRPHRLQPDLPANMAATLDDQLAYGRGPSPAPPPPPPPSFPFAPGGGAYGPPQPARGPSPLPPQQPGFIRPNSAIPPPPPPGSVYGFRTEATPAPPAQTSASNDWNVWALPNSPPPPPVPSFNGMTPSLPQPSLNITSPPLPTPGLSSGPASSPYQPPVISNPNSLTASMSALAFADPPAANRHPHRQSTAYSTYGPQPRSPTPPKQTNGPPSLTAPLPTVAGLSAALGSLQSSGDDAARVAWARDVLSLVDRLHPGSAGATPGASAQGPVKIEDAELARLCPTAVQIVLQVASAAHPGQPIAQKHVAEALYLRGTLANSGSQPEYVPLNPRAAFRDFEQAARGGYHAAWFRLGRDYETVGDAKHAKDCFERGVKYNVEACLYRMGMAHLMGQLGLPANPEVGLPLLHRAATCATVAVPQPAYVYGLLLIDQFAQLTLPSHFFAPLLPPGTSAAEEARKHLERAAYLNFAPAQYKLGHAYEFAQQPFPFDPLLSVQYYSLASQQGEVEADMSLSKWFLCGAEGCFDKDEALAYTFAEKAARKGLPAAEFAMGYYAEVGVGGPKDLEAARKWYTRAANHGNTDAPARLTALAKPSPEAFSRQEHAAMTETTLVRKRTQAKQDSEARRQAQQQQQAPPPMPRTEAQKIVDLARQNSRLNAQRRSDSIGFDSAPQAQQRPPAQQQHPQPHHAATLSSQVGHGRRPSGSQQPPYPAQPQQQQPPGRESSPARPPFANAHRYSLADPGSSASAPVSPSLGPSSPHLGQGARPQLQQQQSSPGRVASGSGAASVASAPAKVQEVEVADRPPMKYQTFQEMGFTGAKVDDKDCVIM